MIPPPPGSAPAYVPSIMQFNVHFGVSYLLNRNKDYQYNQKKILCAISSEEAWHDTV